MASIPSINSNDGHQNHVPNPPPRIHSRPNQPPPPPPLPSIPPVPPTRDSSIAISKAVSCQNGSKFAPPPPPPSINSHTQRPLQSLSSSVNPSADRSFFLSQFESLFKPLHELPPPDPFLNKPKSYPSQRSQHKQEHPVAQHVQS